MIHALLQEIQWQSPRTQQLIMAGTDVKVFAKLSFGRFTERQYLQLADLVGQGLARIADVAVNFIDDIVLGLRCIVFEEVDRLLPCPSLVM